MKTYAFYELDARGQAYAVNHYGQEQIVDEYITQAQDDTLDTPNDFDTAKVFDACGFRFNEHGERIA